MKNICVVINPSSGLTNTQAKISSAFDEHKLDAHYIQLNSSFQRNFDSAYCRGCRTFVAAGGDGTVNALASLLINKENVILGIIPTGTLNHFAKDLGLSTDIYDAVKRIARSSSKLIDVGHINDKIFLNNSSIGIYARIANVKRRTKIWLFRFALGILSGLWFTLKPPHYHLSIKFNGKTLHRTTPIIFVGNNKYDLSGVGLFNRSNINKNILSVYIIKTVNPLRLILVGLSTLIGRINTAYFEAYDVSEVQITTKRNKIYVAYDGEVSRLATPIQYSIKKGELRVIV